MLDQVIQHKDFDTLAYMVGNHEEKIFSILPERFEEIIGGLLMGHMKDPRAVMICQQLAQFSKQFVQGIFDKGMMKEVLEEMSSLRKQRNGLEIYLWMLASLTADPDIVIVDELKGFEVMIARLFREWPETTILPTIIYQFSVIGLFDSEMLPDLCSQFWRYSKRARRINIYLAAQEILLMEVKTIFPELTVDLLRLFVDGNSEIPTRAASKLYFLVEKVLQLTDCSDIDELLKNHIHILTEPFHIEGYFEMLCLVTRKTDWRFI